MEKEEKYIANYGSFKAEGVITDIRIAREGKTKANNDYKVLNIRIKTNKDKILNVELFGQVQSEIEVIKFKGKERETQKIKWSERNNIPAGFQLQNLGSVRVGKEIKTGATSTIKTYTSYDAITEIIENFKLGNSVHIEGSIGWNSYTSSQDGSIRTSMRLSIQKIWMMNDIDFGQEEYKELCHFSQPIVVESTELDENKENLLVNAIIVLNKDGKFVRTEMRVPLDIRTNLAKTLNNKSSVPRYSILPVSGNIVNTIITEAQEDDASDEWGFDAQEQPITRMTGNQLVIIAAQGKELMEKYYKEDDFIYDVLTDDEDTIVEDDGNPFETENDDLSIDDDSDWLGSLE